MALKRACSLILLNLALVTPAAAQLSTGTITGTLGQEPAAWYVTSAEAEDPSGWRRVGNEVEARLVGQVQRDVAETGEGALTIHLQTEGNPTEMNVSEFTITLVPDTDTESAEYSASAANADLDLETLVISGNTMVVAGSFSGSLIEGGADDLVLDDDVPNITVDGNFQASLPLLPSD